MPLVYKIASIWRPAAVDVLSALLLRHAGLADSREQAPHRPGQTQAPTHRGGSAG